MKKLYFLHTPSPKYLLAQDYGVNFMPTWAYTLNSYLDIEEVRSSVIDCRFLDVNEFLDGDIYVFSGINQDFNEIKDVLSYVRGRNSKAKFIIGGPIAWSFSKANEVDLLNFFDHIFIGDGEEYFSFLVKEILNINNTGERFSGNEFLFDGEGLLKKIIVNNKRFDLSLARPLKFNDDFLDSKYYGGVVEVSRGCPFLCEFCDIRVMIDNNKSHNKDINVIIEDIRNLLNIGAKEIILACDNLVGDIKFAYTLVRAIIKLREEFKRDVTFYSWVTITISREEELLRLMRVAGFDLLFIGVESFNKNSLIETAKVQNSHLESLPETLKYIQSFGFIIVAGLILGFDWDDENLFDITLKGINNSGLLTGDPSFLYALPGTPLYKRMELSSRLRSMEESSRSRQKISTNMLYLQDEDFLKDGYINFLKELSSGSFNYSRFKVYLNNLNSVNYIPLTSGYGKVSTFLKSSLFNKEGRRLFVLRIKNLVVKGRLIFIFKAFFYTLFQFKIKNRFHFFKFFIFSWSNLLLNYQSLSRDDLDIKSFKGEITREKVLPKGYSQVFFEEIDMGKIRAQRRKTEESLERLIEEREIN